MEFNGSNDGKKLDFVDRKKCARLKSGKRELLWQYFYCFEEFSGPLFKCDMYLVLKGFSKFLNKVCVCITYSGRYIYY